MLRNLQSTILFLSVALSYIQMLSSSKSLFA